MRFYAPAKINWTLDVLGRRDDGYHEVRSVIQAIDLCDVLDIEPADGLQLEVEGEHAAGEDDLTLRAARLLDGGKGTGARIRVAKAIPAAAGLGGGSSDAAAALRGLNALWRLGCDDARLEALAARLGSDVPFFLRGGTALAEGRGERVTPLPDLPTLWLVLLVPSLKMPDKTRQMYGALTPTDFSDGSCTDAFVEAVDDSFVPADDALHNAFERAAYETFAGLAAYRDALLATGAPRVHLAGSGPALFALAPDEDAANAVRDKVSLPGGRLFVVRTLTAAEALRREG